MPADVAIAVMIGCFVLRVARDVAGVMMCHWAQRQGRKTRLEIRHGRYRLCFSSGARVEDASAPTRRDGETAGEHHVPSPPDASPASRDERHLSVVGGQQ